MSTTNPLRVLSVCTSDVAGGAARAAFRIHESVRQEGVDSRMFVKQKGSHDPHVHALAEYTPQNGFQETMDWVALKIKNKWQHALWRPYRKTMDKNYKSDLRGTRIYGALQKWDYDVLHLHWINNRFIKIEDLPTDKPIVWTLHDSWPFCGVCHYFLDCVGYQQQCGSCPQLGSHDSNDLSYQIWKKKKSVFDTLNIHIVSPSRWLADCAAKSSLFAGRDIRVIPNCLDTNVFRPLTQTEVETNLSTAQKQNVAVSCVLRAAAAEKRLEKPFLLYGAANAVKDRIKGFASLLSALQILDQQGFEANLMVFGAAETELPMRFEHITVTFLGYVSDTSLLVTLYNMADVMVVPSLTENLSCAIMEALSCGTPVCCFNIGGNGDMVEHRVNGYLAKERDCTDMATGIKDCIAHSVEWSVAARESVVKRYSIPIVAKMYLDLYKEFGKDAKIR
ncbi:MAG: glycosyltransferase [Paludibacteraceae bacterium]|nr:glycosyltransferase [Paludibacteraceae bacterium]